MNAERLRPQRLRHTALVWLLLALAVGPWLARMHQVVHGHSGLQRFQQAQIAATVGSDMAASDATAVRHPALWALFAHHGTLDCQALDQLAHGQAPLHVAPWLLPAATYLIPAAQLLGAAPTLFSRLFNARAPPTDAMAGVR